MFARIISSLATRCCRLLGHCDDIHETELVSVHYCVICRDMRIHNHSQRVLDVWIFGETDASGRPCAVPRCVLVREVPSP